MSEEHAATILAELEVCLAAGPGPLAPLRALEAAVTGVPVRLLPSVDIVLRSHVSGLHANRWPTLTPAELDRFQRMPEAWAVMAADCTVAVRAGCGAADRTVRRSCFDIELTAGHRRPDLVLDEALSERDPGVRLWAARRLADAVWQPWAAPVASRALADRTVQVRRVTLAALAPSLPEERARDLLERALLDTNAGARWQARSLLLARGPFDFAALYRRSLATAARGRAQRGPVLGVGQSGDLDDLQLVLPYLRAAEPGTRRAALRARARLEPVTMIEPFLLALRSPESSFSREARRALAARVSAVPLTTLHVLTVDRELPAHTRRNALLLVMDKAKWERLPVLLDACSDNDQGTAKLAVRLVDRWCESYNRSFLQPTAAQISAAAASFMGASHRLNERARVELGHILQGLRRG